MEILNNIITILTIGGLALSILFYVVLIVRKAVTSKTNTTEQTNMVKAENNIFGMIPTLIKEAETLFTNSVKTGPSKLMYVLYKLQEYCRKNNLILNEVQVTNYIEDILDTPQKKLLTTDSDNDIEQSEGINNG